MKTVAFVLTAAVLYVIDTAKMKKEAAAKKDIFVYNVFMILSVMLGILYFTDMVHESIADMIMGIFNVKR